MKKVLAIIFLALIVTVMAVGPASAQPGKTNINGEVTNIAGNLLTIESKRGEFLVTVSNDLLALITVEVCNSVLIKAHYDSGYVADSIKLIGTGDDDGDPEDPDPAEGSKDNSAFCGGDKQDKSHPLALKIAERYDNMT